MRKFRRQGIVITTQLSPDEVMLLQSLIAQLVEMIGEDETDGADGDGPTGGDPTAPGGSGDDPFAVWAKEFEPPGTTAPPDDPALQRLFPEAYRDDPEAAADFRRFTERSLRDKKVGDAQVALQHLAMTDQGRQELRIPKDEVDPWLRTLTSLRLAVAARLGIDDADVAEQLADLPDEDPRAWLASVYDWLGFAQETLLAAL